MGMGAGETSLFPMGNIPVSCFVKLDPSNEGGCLVAGSGDTPFGIAGPETHSPSMTLFGVNLDDGYAGVANGPAIKIYGVGSTNVPLRIGGTVAVGDYLRPNTNGDGKGITTATDKIAVGAVAKQAGSSGQIINVDVVRLQLSV